MIVLPTPHYHNMELINVASEGKCRLMNPWWHIPVHQVLLLQVYQPGTDQDYFSKL